MLQDSGTCNIYTYVFDLAPKSVALRQISVLTLQAFKPHKKLIFTSIAKQKLGSTEGNTKITKNAI